jgi:predicted RNA binding protein YcfA (HicA-like mRNA interferase family)
MGFFCLKLTLMKRIDLIRHLERNDCQLQREGKKHSLYINRRTQKSTAVPRHSEIPQGTARAICRALGIPTP